VVGERPDGDDLAVARRAHVGQAGADAPEDAVGVDVEVARPVRVVDLPRLGGARDPGVGDEDGDRAEGGAGGLRGGVDGRRVGEVDGVGEGAAPSGVAGVQRGGQRRDAIAVAVPQRDPRALGVQAPRGGAAEAARRTGDDGYGALQAPAPLTLRAHGVRAYLAVG
jgi:hypothetical protein